MEGRVINRRSRQAGCCYRFFLVVEKNKEIIASFFAKSTVLTSNKVKATSPALIIRMSGSNPYLTRFDLYRRSLGRDNIEDTSRVYWEMKDRFSDALSYSTIIISARIRI